MKMPSLLLIGLLATTSITAQAGELYTPEQSLVPSVSTLTRAEVKAETLRALKAHEVKFGDIDQPEEAPIVGGRTRAEVKAEAVRAVAAHEIPKGEFDYPPVVYVASNLTRAEVKAEALRALKNHEIQFGDVYVPGFNSTMHAQVKTEGIQATALHDAP